MMGMTIDKTIEFFDGLECHTPQAKDARDVAINTMLKYQEIEQIVKQYKKFGNIVFSMQIISGVVEDEKIDAGRLEEALSRNVVGGNAYFDLINNAPTVEAIPKDQYEARLKADHWIPVTERLPEPLTFVYATCRSLVDNRENWVVETIYAPIPKEYNPRHYSDWGNIPMLNWGDAEVIAWMKREIPEPYKGDT